jgi:NAD(P)H-hydrate epimerase
MRDLDAETINGIGIPSIVLMENASKGSADFFAETWPLPQYKNVLVFAGKGNNGGDGFAAGRILAQKGYHVEFVLTANPAKLNPDPKINYDILEKLDFKVTVIDGEDRLRQIQSLFDRFQPCETFVIDALFGTGLNQPVKPGLFAEIIKLINDSGFKTGAVDIPSGLSDAFLPEEAVCIRADATATFHALKTAHLHPDGNKYCGHIRVIDIGIPYHLEERKNYYIDLIEPGSFDALFSPREVDAHKGSYGHTLTICGSIEKPGAGILSSYAVLKSGAGLCTAAACFENRAIATTIHPELMSLVYKKSTDLLERLKEFNTLLIGPGLGAGADTRDIVTLMLRKSTASIVLDADALNVLQPKTQKDLLSRPRTHPVVLTPHPGEFSRLTGKSVAEIRGNRIELSREFAKEYYVYLILKGHHTLIATPEGKVYVNTTGNPGMASAGSGDVLSGMIAGMLSQSFRRFPIDAILQAAVFIHGYAGDLAAAQLGETSLTAADITRFIPQAITRLDEYQSHFSFAR